MAIMVILENSKEIIKEIKKSKKIFIMGHKDLDLDALGSSIGMALIAKHYNKECFIIIDDKNHEMGVSKILEEQEGCFNIIKSNEVDNNLYSHHKKNLLIVLDTSKSDLVQSSDVLGKITRKIIIDHHEYDDKSIKDGLLVIDNNVSSTCEMLTTLVEKLKIDLESYYATLLLSGIVLDTNNFTLKTNAETYYTAYYLACLGASTKKVQYLLKQDLKEYIERQKLFTDITIIDKIAVSKGTSYAKYRREDLAKVADILLFFNGVEASFVIGKLGDKVVGVSARSMGNYDINNILKEFNGGGDQYNGAARIEDDTVSKINQKLVKLLKEKNQEG